jgi:[acyl-carrier-protein] S-malonyltransferase
VVQRGRAMAAMRDGSMAALLGAEASLAEEVCREVSEGGGGVVVVANLNAPGQVVLSGSRDALERAIALARERGVRRAMPLNVSGAFHSPLMGPAAERFAALLDQASFRDAAVPVACNVDGAAVQDAAGLRDRLRRQLTAPVRWVDCVDTLVSLGVDALVEVGPGAVLTALAKRIAPEVRGVSVARLDDAVAVHA